MPASSLTFLYGEYVPRCTHVIDKHYVGYQTLQYMDGGAVDLLVGTRRYVLQGQWFWSAYPGPRFRFGAAAGHPSWVHRYLAFKGPLVERWQREGLFPVPPCRALRDFNAAERFDELLKHSRRTDRRGIRRAIHLLEGILLELADARPLPQSPAADPERSDWLADAMSALDRAAMGEIPDYAKLSHELGVSQSTLRRQFRRALGTSPHLYLLHRRIEEARRLLGQTDQPVKAIATRLGYRDVYFFSRQFRQFTGVPPAMYRKSRQR